MIYAVENPGRKHNIGEQAQEKTWIRHGLIRTRFPRSWRSMAARLGGGATLMTVHGL
jgi:hypothetical protein